MARFWLIIQRVFRKPVTQRFTVALVVDPGRERHVLVRNFLGVAENIDSAAADGGEKNLVEGAAGEREE